MHFARKNAPLLGLAALATLGPAAQPAAAGPGAGTTHLQAAFDSDTRQENTSERDESWGAQKHETDADRGTIVASPAWPARFAPRDAPNGDPPAAVPEPSTLAPFVLAGVGLLGLGLRARRQRKAD